MTQPDRPGGEDPFAVLLAVQDLDTALSQLHHRKAGLPERRQLGALEAELTGFDARIAEAEAARAELVARQRELEDHIAQINQRREAIEARLYNARGSAARDLQAMDEEVQHLTMRRAELEDEELTSMEAQEPIDAALERLRAERAQVTEAAAGLRDAVAAVEAVIDAEISADEMARGAEAAKLPGPLLDRYEVLRARLKGTGAARLVGNRCEGCHLELPSMEVERIHRLPADAVVTCDQCGRILVRRAPGA
jgi:hypothetical protein